MDLDRRAVLQATGVLATAGVLGACGSSEEPAATPTEEPTTDTTETSATSGGAPSSDGSGGDVAVSDIPVGGGVILAEPAIVVTQPTEGDVKAFTAICPHQGCLVSEVKDNVILCPCHGSLFSAEDGSVLQGPARTGLSPAGVAVDGGAVVIS